MRKWKYWEDSIHEEILKDDSVSLVISPIHQTQFMVDGDRGINYYSVVMTWVHSFFKQFFSSLSHSEYRKMRLGFIMTHCNGNLKFDFYSYMVRAVEEDYKKVVGISWYLWIYVIFFLLMNIGGWHEYFWLSFVPLILLLTVGTKLEQIMGEMFKDVSGDRSIYKGEIVINPSDQYFWFHRPRILLFCIHLILFIVAFQFAYFFCILIAYGYSSCIMDKTKYVVPRLVVSFGVRVIASYSILPLYAIVTQMGSSCKPAIFEEHVKEGLVRWAQQARMRTKRSTTRKPKEEDAKIEIDSTHSDSLVEEGGAGIVQEPGPDSLHRPTMGSCV